MSNFIEYTEKAINRYGLRGNNALARELGIKSSSMSLLYNGKTLPSEETMIKLAELAGMPKEEALIDLNLWRSKDKPELQKVWLRLSKMIGCFVFSCLIFNELAYANTNTTLSDNVYYVVQKVKNSGKTTN